MYITFTLFCYLILYKYMFLKMLRIMDSLLRELKGATNGGLGEIGPCTCEEEASVPTMYIVTKRTSDVLSFCLSWSRKISTYLYNIIL